MRKHIPYIVGILLLLSVVLTVVGMPSVMASAGKGFGANYKCEADTVWCPPPVECLPPSHCNLNVYHKYQSTTAKDSCYYHVDQACSKSTFGCLYTKYDDAQCMVYGGTGYDAACYFICN